MRIESIAKAINYFIVIAGILVMYINWGNISTMTLGLLGVLYGCNELNHIEIKKILEEKGK